MHRGSASSGAVAELANDAPIQAKVNQVGDQTTKNGQEIQQTSTDLTANVKGVDERAQTGISAAKEQALTAQNSAQNAMSKARRGVGSGKQGLRGDQEFAPSVCQPGRLQAGPRP